MSNAHSDWWWWCIHCFVRNLVSHQLKEALKESGVAFVDHCCLRLCQGFGRDLLTIHACMDFIMSCVFNFFQGTVGEPGPQGRKGEPTPTVSAGRDIALNFDVFHACIALSQHGGQSEKFTACGSGQSDWGWTLCGAP